ncbi:MAG: TetR family transcriptional regulator [Polyangiaceae bacterium]
MISTGRQEEFSLSFGHLLCIVLVGTRFWTRALPIVRPCDGAKRSQRPVGSKTHDLPTAQSLAGPIRFRALLRRPPLDYPVPRRNGGDAAQGADRRGAARDSDRGSLDVTVAQIAERAGVSAALAHHYFGGKDGLIHATMRYLLVELVFHGLRRASTPREQIDAVLRGSFGPEQFHRATVSAWLTFYALAQSSQPAARLLPSITAGSTRTSCMRCAIW